MIYINEQIIINYCGQEQYNKGRNCSNINDYLKVFVTDNTIFGLYIGSVGTYKINIIFSDDELEYSWCTCPAMSQYYGKCKHIAGLLILWLHSPSKFTVVESWKKLLENKSKEELVQLLTTTCQRSFDVANVIYEQIKGEPLIEEEYLNDY